MAWSWIRPADRSVLSGRPLLDVGTADGQTLAALVEPSGLVVGVDRSMDAVRTPRGPGAALVAGEAARLPFRAGTFTVALGADLLHHVPDEELTAVLGEIARVLRPGGSLVAWWWAEPGRPAHDAPRYPRALSAVASRMTAAGFREAEELELEVRLPHGPPTIGILATT